MEPVSRVSKGMRWAEGCSRQWCRRQGEGEGVGAVSFCSDIVHLGSGFITGEVSESHSIVSDCLQPYGWYSPWGRKESDTTEGLSLSLLVKP